MALALIAVWSSFDRQAATVRFLLLSLAAVVFYLVSQESANAHRHTHRILALVGIAISFGVLLQQVLALPQSDISEFEFPLGFMVIALPFLVSEWRMAARRLQRHLNSWLFATLIVAVSIAVSGSMASILILALGAAACASWAMASRLSRAFRWRRIKSTAVAIVGAGSAVAGFILIGKGWILSSYSPEMISGRLEIKAQAARLIGDYPLVGGGLGTVPGLYAHYIHGLPVSFVPHSQNLYLNLGLELGLIGLLMFVIILTASAVIMAGARAELSKHDPDSWHAPFAGLIALSLLGLIDDPLYMSWALPLLLVFPGLALSIASTRGFSPGLSLPDAATRLPILTLLAAGLIVLAVASWQTVVASWLSNLGAVEMAKVELSAWPSARWSEGENVHSMSGSESRFVAARRYRPGDRTALHRLGLIAMERREYGKAVELLSEAHFIDPGHRGIRKALGYSLIWTGEYRRARTILDDIDEVPNELRIYNDWWLRLGREDLSLHAAEMLELLQSG